MFAAIALPASADPGLLDRLVLLARDWSPRVERLGATIVVLDITGVGRLFGEAQTMGSELQRVAGAMAGLPVQVGIAATRMCAALVACAHPGVTVVPRGEEARTLAPLPLSLLSAFDAACPERSRGTLGNVAPQASPAVLKPGGLKHSPHVRPQGSRHYRMAPLPQPRRRLETAPLAVLARWGLRTLGDLAALPAGPLRARLGEAGHTWQRLARGEDARPLVPESEDERFEETLPLEWPIEGLEPLSFVLGRLLDALCAHLLRADRGAAVLHVRLRLVTRDTWTRSLQLPAPFRDPRVLRTLALLDLESHPPPAAIDVVTVAVDPTPGRVVQFSLLERGRPSAEQLSTLLARLRALMGADRCNAPALIDTHRPEAFAMADFQDAAPRAISPPRAGRSLNDEPPRAALRRFRHPVPVRVRLAQGRPAHVAFEWGDLRGGAVATAAGPWRSSGDWWNSPRGGAPEANSLGPAAAPWNRDEWDVSTADGSLYVIFRDRPKDRWFLSAVVD